LALLEEGRLHLTAICLLRDHLTEDNHEALLREAAGKSKFEIEELIAKRNPKRDVPATIRELPMSGAASLPAMAAASPAAASATPEPKPRLLPLAESRYKLELTASGEMKAKLERAADLLRHCNPSGDLAVVVDRALDALLDDLEKTRLGKTSRPQKPRPTKRGRVSRSVRRQVFARDGEQCTFVSADGTRCRARGFLQLDHQDPKACGGPDTAPNLTVRCAAHNRLAAEEHFGREFITKKIHRRQQRCVEPDPPDDVFATVLCGLRNLGFRENEARGAIGTIRARVDSAAVDLPPLEQLLRQALAILT
jgi:hypothetical protein